MAIHLSREMIRQLTDELFYSERDAREYELEMRHIGLTSDAVAFDEWVKSMENDFGGIDMPQ